MSEAVWLKKPSTVVSNELGLSSYRPKSGSFDGRLTCPLPYAPAGSCLGQTEGQTSPSSHLFLVASLLLVAMPGAPSSFWLLLVRHLLLEAMHLFLVAS